MQSHAPAQRLVNRPTPPEQLGMETLWQPAPKGRPSIDELFDAFHAERPEVYAKLVTMTRQAKAAGRTRVGVKMMIEVLRWEHFVSADHDKPFAINNVLASRYARKIMAEHPDLDGMFTTRALHPRAA